MPDRPGNLVCGFMVVRRPEFDWHYDDVPAPPHSPRTLGNRVYAGADRVAWEELLHAIDQGSLPKSLEAESKEILFRSKSPFSRALCTNYALALRLLEFCNSTSRGKDELICLRGTALADMVGVMEFHGAPVRWIGFDVCALGEFSLISGGVFEAPDAFAGWPERLNRHGLLDDPDDCPAYRDAYDRAVQSGLVEEYGAEEIIEPIEVGTVLVGEEARTGC